MNKGLTPPHQSVAPTRPVAPWLGGKRNLAKRICALIDADTNHSTNTEPFVGIGGIFLRRTSRPRAEVIHDFGRAVNPLLDDASWGDLEQLVAT